MLRRFGLGMMLWLGMAGAASAQTSPLSTFIYGAPDVTTVTSALRIGSATGNAQTRYVTADELNTYWASKLGGSCTASTLAGAITIACSLANPYTSNISFTGTVGLPSTTTLNGTNFATVATSGSAGSLTGTLGVLQLPAFSGGDATAPGGSSNLQLNTVNGSPGTYSCGGTFSVTVNAKGLTTGGQTGNCAGGGGGGGGPGQSIALDGTHSLALDSTHGLRLQ